MLISLIAAVAKNGVIGKDGKLPWHLPADLQFFKKTTMGSPIITGRKNFEGIGKVLPGRMNIVLTRNKDFSANCSTENLKISASLKEAFEIAEQCNTAECFVIGGAQIYKEALPFCQKLYITRVHEIFDGDTLMPSFENGFRKVSCTNNFKDERNLYDYDFEIYERV